MDAPPSLCTPFPCAFATAQAANDPSPLTGREGFKTAILERPPSALGTARHGQTQPQNDRPGPLESLTAQSPQALLSLTPPEGLDLVPWWGSSVGPATGPRDQDGVGSAPQWREQLLPDRGGCRWPLGPLGSFPTGPTAHLTRHPRSCTCHPGRPWGFAGSFTSYPMQATADQPLPQGALCFQNKRLPPPPVAASVVPVAADQSQTTR